MPFFDDERRTPAESSIDLRIEGLAEGFWVTEVGTY